MDNANSREYLDKILTSVLENMRRTVQAPSVQASEIPGKSIAMHDDEEAEEDDLDEDLHPDARKTQRRSDKRVEGNGELDDSDDEDEAGMPSRLPGREMRRARMNYRGIMDVAQDSGVETGSVGTPAQGSSIPDDDMNLDTENPSPQQNGSAAVSGVHTPAANGDEDVTMGDAEAISANGTGPEPPAASAAEDEEAVAATNEAEASEVQDKMQAEDNAIRAEEEGRLEKDLENAEGEAKAAEVEKKEKTKTPEP
jgi:histone deacetylase 1/2